MSTATYSPKRMIISIAGTQITGFGDSDMLTVSLDEDKFVKYTSVDGEVSRSFNVPDTGRFVLTLNQTSQANSTLSGLLTADVFDNTGNLTFPVAIRDQNSEGTFYLGTDCWVVGMPESGFGKEIGTREWVIDASKIRYAITGAGEGIIEGIVEGLI